MRWMAVSDPHSVCQHDEGVRAARDFMADYKPEIRIHLGDNWDLAAWRKKAGNAELQQDTWQCIDSGIEFLEWFRPTELNLGNHDWRLWRAAYYDDEVDGRRRDYARILIEQHITPVFERLGTKVYEYRIRHQTGVLGPWRHFHGFRSQGGKHAAYWLGLKWRGSSDGALCGHLHRYEVSSADDINGSRGVVAPCMCDREKMCYVDEELGAYRWDVGWLYGEVEPGRFTWSAQIVA